MTALLPPFPKFRAFDLNGLPLAGGLLYSYAAGTTTPLATYTDSTGATPNTNPVVLDSTGQANVWLTTGTAYKFVLEDITGVVQWTVDQITGGLQGVAGTPGSVWRNGSGAPSNSIGIDGDYYLNITTGDVLQRSAGVYTKVANIQGPAGSLLNRINNGRFYLGLSPWVATGTNPPTLGAAGSSALSGCAQQFADQSTVVVITSDGSINQSFSTQTPNGSQFLTFKTSCWLAGVLAQNTNTGYVKVYIFDGQNATETLIGTYNLTATSSTAVWTTQTIDVTASVPAQGDYGIRFELQAKTDNTGGASGTKGTNIAVDDVVLITSAAGGTAISTNALNSASTTINVSSATAPIAGQVLTATSSTTANWQNGPQVAYTGIVSQNLFPTVTGVASLTGKMLGLAVQVTPAKSTRLKVTATGTIGVGVNDAINVEHRYGTGGTPPANGTAATGTLIGSKNQVQSAGSGGTYSTGFAQVAILTGLTLGTLYWFDLNIYDSSGSTMTPSSVTLLVEEV